jgi:hypothetical protein
MLFPDFSYSFICKLQEIQCRHKSRGGSKLASGIVNHMLHPADPADLSMEYEKDGRAWLRMPNYPTFFPNVKNYVTDM